ncbi:hypothetical protein LP7551_01637 [Roseibium album]|nr:hypothetical protein LP7551_01637 [Roseibium album]
MNVTEYDILEGEEIDPMTLRELSQFQGYLLEEYGHGPMLWTDELFESLDTLKKKGGFYRDAYDIAAGILIANSAMTDEGPRVSTDGKAYDSLFHAEQQYSAGALLNKGNTPEGRAALREFFGIEMSELDEPDTHGSEVQKGEVRGRQGSKAFLLGQKLIGEERVKLTAPDFNPSGTDWSSTSNKDTDLLKRKIGPLEFDEIPVPNRSPANGKRLDYSNSNKALMPGANQIPEPHFSPNSGKLDTRGDIPVPQVKTERFRTHGEVGQLGRFNPFDLASPRLHQQAELVERDPIMAKRLILAAGRDPKLFRL